MTCIHLQDVPKDIFLLTSVFEKCSIPNAKEAFNLRTIFTSPIKTKNFFSLQEKTPKMLISGFVYKCKYDSCNATYCSKIKGHF